MAHRRQQIRLDQRSGQPLVFQIGSRMVNAGLEHGVVAMKVGGKRRFVVAPEWGYGARGLGKIPPNAVLVYEVELLAVK